ncbi:MAG TPA: hypothetical protein PKZ08_03935 [Vicinamibacterales bacterium]|nr:hypothetical protein [Vicinamibacterales bacterium]
MAVAALLLLSASALLTAQGRKPGVKAPSAQPPRVGPTDPALRLTGFDAHRAKLASSPYRTLAWQFLGPKNVSGRTTDVAVIAPRGRSYTIYVATATGGLWKTDNEGTTWRPVFDQGPSTTIGDVTAAPSDPDIVWMGTGEANIFRSSQAGAGVYKSVDAGTTWQHMGLAGTYTIPRIVIHPTRPDTVYVAASGREWTDNPERGVYKTTDGGRTWAKVLFVDDRTGAIDLVMDPSDPETLYAATWQRIRLKWNDPRNLPSYTGSGIHKTTDGGRTWVPINAGLPEAKFRGRIGLDVSRSAPNVLYALVDNYELSREPTEEERADPYGLPSSGFIKGATVYRSNDKGATWAQVSGLTPEQKAFMERHSNTYGWVFGQVRVDPTDAETVYTMGLGLNVSTDGGRTFRQLRTPGIDHHALWIDPDNPSYLVNAYDQGLAISYDRGATWKDTRLTLPVAQFFNVSYDMSTPFRVYGSMQDHGSFRAAVDLSRGRDRVPAADFERAPGGEGSTHAIDPDDPDIVYSSGFYGTLTRSDLAKPAGSPQRSKSLLPARYPDEPRLRGEWLAPTIVSPHNGRTIYHGMQYLMRSRDRGDTWDIISPDLTSHTGSETGDIPYHTITAISESPLRAGLIYVGTDDGKVHVTRDGGASWTEILAGLPHEKWVSRIVASAFDLATVYLTQSGKRDDDFTPYVWKSADFGRTWVSLAGDVPIGPVNVIREDPSDRNILYLGTDLSVYATADGGTSWQPLGGNLPSTYVLDLVIHPRDNVVVIATHGRGMWVLDAEPVNRRAARPRRPAGS